MGYQTMTKCEFWLRLRELERKYDMKTHSPVRKRLRRIDAWASAILRTRSPSAIVPCWLCNELLHVEERRCIPFDSSARRKELSPVYADMLFHGVLSGRPWRTGNVLLPSETIMRKKPTDV